MKKTWKVALIVAVVIVVVLLLVLAVKSEPVDEWRYWTTPVGAEGGEYDLRYTTNPADTTGPRMGWSGWVEGIHAPGVAGTPDSQLVEGLEPGTIYYFAIWSAYIYTDSAGNYVELWSEISNIVVDTTGQPSIVPEWITDFR